MGLLRFFINKAYAIVTSVLLVRELKRFYYVPALVKIFDGFPS